MRAVVHDEHRALAERHWWFRARRAILARFLDACVPLPERARILDVGPGSGVNLPVLAPRGRVTVLDLDAGSLRGCAARGARALVLGDATSPPLREASFDLIAALDVLEHLADDLGALRAWRSLLCERGRLLVTVPALPCLWGRQDELAGHLRRYRKRVLAGRLREAGFVLERLTHFNALLLPGIAAVRLALRPFLRWTTRHGGSDLAMGSLGLDGLLYRAFAAEARWLPLHDLPLGVSLLALARRSG